MVWYAHLLENFPQFVVIHTVTSLGFPDSSNGKESTCNAGATGLITAGATGRSPGGGNGNPLLHSCLENLMDRGGGRVQSEGSERVGQN